MAEQHQPSSDIELKASDDPTAASRKADHIDLAFASHIASGSLDKRFYYEPLLAAHPKQGSLPTTPFGKHTLPSPLWVSSMTGGTEKAKNINRNLAKACREFGMGMGLGSCRSLLFSNDRLEDFDMRPLIGPNLPLYANLGIAQIEQLIEADEIWRIDQLLEKLSADGLIIHVNPMQEWLQPEGDRFALPPIDTIEHLLANASYPVIVKEVGQGIGPASLRRLLTLPLEAIEFAAAGGTNFARLENLRSDKVRQQVYESLEKIGHSAEDMVGFVNQIADELGAGLLCKTVIISGGVKDYLDGYYLRSICQLNSVYGQASAFLRHATVSYDALQDFVAAQIRGLELANAYLNIR